MKLGEVCLLTTDVVRLANFYKRLLDIDNGSQDPMHQFLIQEETSLAVLQDDGPRTGQSVVLAFTVEDIEAVCQKLLDMGVQVVEGPTPRPWGAVNMSCRDPDGNLVYFRAFPNG